MSGNLKPWSPFNAPRSPPLWGTIDHRSNQVFTGVLLNVSMISILIDYIAINNINTKV